MVIVQVALYSQQIPEFHDKPQMVLDSIDTIGGLDYVKVSFITRSTSGGVNW